MVGYGAYLVYNSVYYLCLFPSKDLWPCSNALKEMAKYNVKALELNVYGDINCKKRSSRTNVEYKWKSLQSAGKDIFSAFSFISKFCICIINLLAYISLIRGY